MSRPTCSAVRLADRLRDSLLSLPAAVFLLTVTAAAFAAPPNVPACQAWAIPSRDLPDAAVCAVRFGVSVQASEKGREDAANRLYEDASAQIDQRRYDLAASMLNCAEALVGGNDNWRNGYEIMRRRGVLAYREERIPEALGRFECALKIASDHDDRAAIAKSLNNVGSALRRLGDYGNALRYLTDSLEMQRADGGATGRLLMNLGDFYRELNDSEKSLLHYRQALEAFRKSDEPTEAAHVLEGMSAIAFEDGDMAQAEQRLEQALALYRENDSRVYLPRVYAGLIRIALEDANLDRAQAWSIAAIAMSDKEISAIPAPLQLQIARLDRTRGRPKAAQVRIRTALADLSEGDTARPDLLQELASIQQALGDPDAAIATMRLAQKELRAVEAARHDRELGWQRSRFEAAERERTIAALETEARIRKIQLWLIAALATIVCLAVVLLSMRRWQRLRVADTARRVRHEEALARYRRETDALAEDRDLLQALLDSRNDAMCLLDAEGRVMAANRAACVSLGANDGEIAGRALTEYLDDADRDALGSALERMEDVEAQSFEFSCANGASRLNGKLAPWGRGDGLIVLTLEDAAILASAVESTPEPSSEREGAPTQAVGSMGLRTDFRRDVVELMLAVIDAWERSSGHTRIELAERSRIWRVNIDDGRLRVRSMDRYLSVSRLPQNPRWRDVLRTAYFVLGHCALEANVRDDLQRRIDAVLAYTRRSALV